MANDLPTNSYDQFTQQQETGDKNIYDFWSGIWNKFNPQAPTAQSQNALPGMNLAGQNSIDQAKGLLGGGAAPGSLDLNGLNSRVMNNEQTRGLRENLSNENNDINQNYRTGLQYGENALGRMNTTGRMNDRMNELPIDRMGQQYATNDSINSMWNNYNNTKGDFFTHLLGGAGQLGGTLLGKAFGKSNGDPSLPSGFESSPWMDDPAGISNNMQLPNIS